MLSDSGIISVLKGQPGLKGPELAANSVGNPQSRVAILGKLVGVSTRLDLFEPLKWLIIKKER